MMTRLEAENLRRLLAGGLYTDAKSEGLRLQDAALVVAAAQLRAIRFALAAADQDPDPPTHNDGRSSWDFGDCFDKADAVIALGGVCALLDGIHHAAGDVERALEEPESEAAT